MIFRSIAKGTFYRILLLSLLLLGVRICLLSQSKPVVVFESGQQMYPSHDDVVFSSNNRFIAIKGDEGMRIYDLRSGYLIKNIFFNEGYNRISSTLSPDFRYVKVFESIKSQTDNANVEIVKDLFSDSIICKGNLNEKLTVAGKLIIRDRIDTVRILINGQTGLELEMLSWQGLRYSYTVSEDGAYLLICSPERRIILSTSNLDTVKILNYSTKVSSLKFFKNHNTLERLSTQFSPDNRYIISLNSDYQNHKLLQVYDTKRDSIVFYREFTDGISYEPIYFFKSSFIDYRNKLVAVADEKEEQLSIYTFEGLKLQQLPVKQKEAPWDLKFSSNGSFVSIEFKNGIKIYDVKSGKVIHSSRSRNYLFSPNLPLVYLKTDSSLTTKVRIYDLIQRKIIKTMEGEIFKISNDGRVIFGNLGFKSYLMNPLLNPIREINTCTSFARNIKEIAPNMLEVEYDEQCDFINRQDQSFERSSVIWDLQKLSNITLKYIPVPMYASNVMQDEFSNGKYTIISKGDFSDVSDSLGRKAILKKYGDLKSAHDNLFVFNKSSIAISWEPSNDTISLLGYTDSLIVQIAIRGRWVSFADVNAIEKNIYVLYDLFDKVSQTALEVYDFRGRKKSAIILSLPDTLDKASISKIDLVKTAQGNKVVIWTTKEDTQSFGNGFLTGIYVFNQAGKLTYRKTLKDYRIDLATGTIVYPIIKDGIFVDRSNSLVREPIFTTGTKDAIDGHTLDYNQEFLLLYVLDPATQPMTFARENNFIKLITWKDKRVHKEVKIDQYVYVGAVSGNGNWFAHVNSAGEIVVTPGVNNSLANQFTLPSSQNVLKLLFTLDGSKLISWGTDGIIRIWSLKDRRELFNIANLNGNDFIITTPAGYYWSSKNARLKFGFRQGDRLVTANQLDVVFNRPDKLLQAAQSPDSLLTKAYYQAWRKRQSRLRLNEINLSSFNPPELSIVNSDTLSGTSTSGFVNLRIHAAGAVALQSINVLVNSVPIYGKAGIRLKRPQLELDTLLQVALSSENNRIEVFVKDANEIKSLSVPLFVQYLSATKPSGKTYFIGIALTRFKEQGHDLNWSLKDIRDLTKAFDDQFNSSLLVDTLLNEKATRANILNLRQKLLCTTIHDKVIISYSGHGLLSEDFDYYLSTFDISFHDPSVNGLLYEELESLLDGIPARKKLLLIDACHSGEIDKPEINSINQVKNTISEGVKGGIVRMPQQKAILGSKSTLELTRELFDNIEDNTGSTIVAASSGVQFAIERGDLRNGVFTFSVLEAIYTYPSITISEFKRVVSQKVETLTKGLQRPWIRSETNGLDWKLMKE